MRIAVPSVLLVLLAACDTPPADDGSPSLVDTEAYRAQEVLVSVDDGDDGVARMLVEEDFGLQELDRLDDIGVSRMRIPEDASVKDVAAALEGDYRVRYAEPNYIARIAATPSTSDTYVGYQWSLDQMNVAEAWAYGRGEGVVVAVVDSGVRAGGPDGIANLLPGYDFYNNDSDPTDDNGHGTFVAGEIAQATDNGVGLAGTAPGVSILPVKVMSRQGYGDINAIASGITYAADQGADVINMSLGSAYSSQTMYDACQYAANKGVVLVAASGNEFASSLSYPAGYDMVISVGATRYDGSRAGYSNTGTGLDLVAPGGDLSRDQNGDGYADGVLGETFENNRWTYTFWEGTSMASPHVAAVAALVRAQGNYTPDEVRDILTRTATDTGSAGYDTETGYGIVNAAAAVALAAGSSGGSGGTDTGGSTGTDTGGSTGTDTGGSTGTDTGGSTGTDTGASTPTDTTAPVISNVDGYTQGRNFTITWVTDEPADSYIDFRDYGEYGDDALTTSHTLQFSGQRGTRYYFDIKSTDAAGNTAVDGTWYIDL